MDNEWVQTDTNSAETRRIVDLILIVDEWIIVTEGNGVRCRSTNDSSLLPMFRELVDHGVTIRGTEAAKHRAFRRNDNCDQIAIRDPHTYSAFLKLTEDSDID